MGFFDLYRYADILDDNLRLSLYARHYKSLRIEGLHYVQQVNKSNTLLICRPNHETHKEATSFLVHSSYEARKFNTVSNQARSLKKFLDFLLLWNLEEELSTLHQITQIRYPLEIILKSFADYLRLITIGKKPQYAVEWALIDRVPLHDYAMMEGKITPTELNKWGTLQRAGWSQMSIAAINPILNTACSFLNFLSERTLKYSLLPIEQIPIRSVSNSEGLLAGTLGGRKRVIFDVEKISKDISLYGPGSNSRVKPVEVASVFSEKDADAFLGCLDPVSDAQDRLLFNMLRYLGIRAGEVANIRIVPSSLPENFSDYHGTKKQIKNFLEGDLRFLQKEDLLGRWVLSTGYKTKASRREIPWISHKIIEGTSNRVIQSFPSQEHFLDMLYWALLQRRNLLGDKKDHGYLFLSAANQSKGNPITEKTVYKKFKRIANSLFFRTSSKETQTQSSQTIDIRDYSPHTFRHLYATVLLKRYKININDISHWLGHSSVSTTHDTYIHWLPDDINNIEHGSVQAISETYEKQAAVLKEKNYEL